MAQTITEEKVTWRSMAPIIGSSTLGTAIEWYDFFLYTLLSGTIFAKLYFPTLNPTAGVIAAFTTNFVGLAARPVGGAFFGWFGDRVGRKSTLVATMLLMGIATLLIGLLPDYATLGIAAPILLSILRFLQGVGVGGEWGGSVLLTLENSDTHRRGFWASWPQAGLFLGLGLAGLAIVVFTAIFPGSLFLSIGWRIPFLLSVFLIVVGLVIRLRLLETPLFSKIKEEKRVSHSPLLEVFKYHWREILLTTLLRSGEQAPFYIFTAFVFTYGTRSLNLDSTAIYIGIVLTAIVGFASTLGFSTLSDIIGRKRWFLLGLVLMAAYAYPYFLLLRTKNPVLIAIAVVISLGICHAWLYGPEAAMISERFGTKLRYTGASLGYQLASITAGGPAPIIATYLYANHQTLSPGLPDYTLIVFYIIGMCVISFVVVFGLREYARKAVAPDIEEREEKLALVEAID
ncbi:MAG TPA: MFS transporter [Ktedonobacteraceae bacterium]|jgi:MFS family permease|nr:MFS transporter [Ktedonobacteraceae bacterium]